ncbi:hypothetical protein ANCDUO_05895 [Ancylostoma duodenale]|uniref:Uncharacterized protein n=1 Tax=Ancylostoma duodenale TaxID=51022 RepID=A0A0C2GXL3_9BILA|nr:hypothetical protein ANCDUO_05895 [Ancylostoma duodenale]
MESANFAIFTAAKVRMTNKQIYFMIKMETSPLEPEEAFMKPPIWDENTFKDVLIPAVASFVTDGTKDVEKVQLLSSTVVFRKVDPHDVRFRVSQINTGDDSDYHCWKDVATRFGVCYCRLEGEKVVESEFRPFRVIPHIVPIIAIIRSDDTFTVVYDELGPDWVDLNTVLRYSYSNIEQYSQVHNFAAAAIADVFFQLDRLKFYVRDPQFLCDNVFWLLCDPFANGHDDYPHEDFAYQRRIAMGTLEYMHFIMGPIGSFTS